MAIDNITQTISTLPPAGRRGVDVQNVFVSKQEDFQDHLQGTTVAELNTLKTQINTTVTGMNIAVETINTKASEASVSASASATSATSASASATSATTSRNQAETFAQQAQASATSVDANNIVHRTNNESIAGVKTFTDSVIVPTPTTGTQATNKDYVDNAVNNIVHRTNNESIAGVKTFTDSVIVPTPTTGTQATNKDYVDNAVNNKVTSDVFNKPAKGVLFTKMSPSSISIPAGFKYTSGVNSYKLVTDYTLTLDSNLVGSSKTAGTDYFVYAKSDATFYISADDAITADRLIGGFHYGLVGETEAVTGNKLEADMVKIRGINQYSFWDLKYRPVASPKGMVNIGGKWYDIYLLNSEHITNGTSKARLTIAGGDSVTAGRLMPKIPLEYRGNNTLNYGKFTWFQACEVAKANAKRLISYSEFPTIAYGVLEGVSSATNAYETVTGKIEHYPNLTSKYGIEQATGVQWIWGADLANYPTGTTWAWRTNTDSRGQIYAMENSPTAVLLGGYRSDGVSAGSLASNWHDYVWHSYWHIGCRFACDHLELE